MEGRVLLASQLLPTADTFVRKPEFRDVNFGAAPYMWVKTAAPESGADRVAYLKFNLDDLGNNGVGNATLYLSGALQTESRGPITAAVYAIPDTSWQEGNGDVAVRRRNGSDVQPRLSGTDIGDGNNTGAGMDWFNQPFDWENNPGGTGLQKLAEAVVHRDTFQTYAFDVSSYVQQQKQAGATAVTFAVRAVQGTQHFIRFASREFNGVGGDGAGKPRLVVSRAGQPNQSWVRAAISAPDAGGTGGVGHGINVTYSSDSGIDISRIDPDDVVVRHEDGGPALQVINPVSEPPFNQPVVTANYTVVGPGGSWDQADNGLYTVELRDGAVRDEQGNDNPVTLGSFRVAINDAERPRAAIDAGPGVTAPGGNTYSFVVTYTDNVAINTATVNVNNVGVSRPNGGTDLTVLSAIPDPDSDAGTVRVTYTVQAADGSWDAGDNGSYMIEQRNTQVRDTAGLDTGTEVSLPFVVAIGPNDGEAPVVESVGATAVGSPGGTSHTVTVVYRDNVAIDASTIGVSDIEVRGPGNVLLPVTRADVNPLGSGTPRTVLYTITPPGGTWDEPDNGTYTITVRADEVRDTSGNSIAGRTGSFDVNATQVDAQAPAASLTSAPPVTAAGGTEHSFVVTYTDAVGVDVATARSGSAINVIGPGGQPLTLLSAVPNPDVNAQTIAVTYRFQARGGTWDGGDSGTYAITLNAGVIKDAAGNANGGQNLGSFQVSLTPPDTQAPTASPASLQDVTGGSATIGVVVNYTDNVAIDQSNTSIDTGDIVVTGRGGEQLPVTAAIIAPGSTDTNVTVTYLVQGPGGAWDDADEGVTYVVAVQPGAVRDTSGNTTPGGIPSQSFEVHIGGRDTTGPTATFGTPSIQGTPQDLNATPPAVTVTYTDGGKVAAGTIGAEDITITRAGGGPGLVVTSANASPNNASPTVQATYTLAPAGGAAWTAAHSGTYTVALNPGEVKDAKGNAAAPDNPAAWTFTVTVQIVDNTNPVATITSAPGIAEATTRQQITVQYTDDVAVSSASIGLRNLVLRGPNGQILEPAFVTVTPSSEDAPLLTATYDFELPGGAWDAAESGTWAIEFNTAEGAVRDVAGKPIQAAAGSFVVNIAPTNPIDPGFNNGFANTGFTTEAITTQPGDYKVIAVGRQGGPSSGGYQGIIQRRLADGTLDASFGNGGQVVVDPVNGADTVFYAVEFIAGKIVVAGAMNNDMVLSRYNLDGTLDQTFGVQGRIFTDFGGAIGEAAYSIARGNDGKIVIGGATPFREEVNGDLNFAFARFDRDGQRDTTFGGGMVAYGSGSMDVIGSVVVLPNGWIIGAGSAGTDVVLLRLDDRGNQDMAFGTDGILRVPGLKARDDQSPFLDRSQALATHDQMILVGNHTADGNFAVVRLNEKGVADASFGQGGMAVVDLGGNDDVDSIVVQPNSGTILVVGTTDAGPGGQPATAVAALDGSGRLIEGWNAGGKLIFEHKVASTASELHIGQLVLRAFGTRDEQGRLVVGSSDRAPTTSSSALRRLLPPGLEFDPQFPALGRFGYTETGSRRATKFVHTTQDGRQITFMLKAPGNAVGQVFGSDDRFDISVSDGSGVSIIIKVKGPKGANRVTLGNVLVNGLLRSFNAKTADLTGTFFVTGGVGKMRMGAVNGGTIAAAEAITSLVADSLANAKILSGAHLGNRAQLGGTGVEGDTFRAGVIGTVKVAGQVVKSLIAAGLNPGVDSVIGNQDDAVVGGASSVIRTVSARGGIDNDSRIISGVVGPVKAPRRLPVGDPRVSASAQPQA